VEQEGVIKYRLAFRNQSLLIDEVCLEKLNSGRDAMLALGLIGQDDSRYGGYGFGNISLRCTKGNEAFWISATQTGHLTNLSADNVSLVTQTYPDQNVVVAQGSAKPSSESMSHGVLYQLSSLINAVIHVHSPTIWKKRVELCLARTPEEVPYGTPEMADSIKQLASKLIQSQEPLLFCMDGHKDGVIMAGESLKHCSDALVSIYQKAQTRC
jgi:ribulose-5-phosphate 4-epimerase/fuculose-1-phosphate aldolase